ncbi:MAG TPA: 50S ribosomal protein L29 [Candidatus Paceibacterota bacterium]|nr:50S ribosomal protein L29 [Candidatus Paceibacterota bacterium]
MKIKELRQKTEKELKETFIHLRDNLRELRFNLASGKVKNINEIHRTRRDIARILTLLKQHGQENK